jgi:hypothetical protein
MCALLMPPLCWPLALARTCATFADNPIASAVVAQGKLSVLALAARALRARHHRS